MNFLQIHHFFSVFFDFNDKTFVVEPFWSEKVFASLKHCLTWVLRIMRRTLILVLLFTLASAPSFSLADDLLDFEAEYLGEVDCSTVFDPSVVNCHNVMAFLESYQSSIDSSSSLFVESAERLLEKTAFIANSSTKTDSQDKAQDSTLQLDLVQAIEQMKKNKNMLSCMHSKINEVLNGCLSESRDL